MRLKDEITVLKGIGPKKAKAFAQHGINNIEDLLYFFPRKYEDRREVAPIGEIVAGTEVLICGKILSKKGGARAYGRKSPLSLLASDDSGIIEIVFFNGRYIDSFFKLNSEYSFYGKVSENFDRKQMVHPEFHRRDDADDIRGIVPIYPQISGISQNELRRIEREVICLAEGLEEWLPIDVVKEYKLADPSFAIKNIHFPKDRQSVLQGKYRLVFEELLALETGLFYIRRGEQLDKEGILIDGYTSSEFRENLPFSLTEGQLSAWQDISKDLNSHKSMNRLIQGDVGSGKTVLAEMAMYSASKAGYQSVMMAPTEILAKQHFSSIMSDFEPYGIRVGLLCSSMSKKEKEKVLSQLYEGAIDVLIGTHAVIEKSVEFRNLGLVITDEQHRFGVRQRVNLASKSANPNILVMTATPIPRTLAVILYGDLDISQIRTMPKGRKQIKTTCATPKDRSRVYNFVKAEIEKGRQAYIVAPLIEDSEKIDARSAEELYSEISKKFINKKIALLHGAMKQEEKDAVMDSFVKGQTDVLVSTVVIEVGINVPNATIIVIENSERFGLAQMHQLRGRVGRGQEQSHCFLINYSDSQIAADRCRILCQSSDGFLIAEEDLKLRGPGEIFGTKQHGLPELQISDLVRHGDVLEKAKQCGRSIIDEDPTLMDKEHSVLKEKIKKIFGDDMKLYL